jgi:hypothetical protein
VNIREIIVVCTEIDTYVIKMMILVEGAWREDESVGEDV